MSNNTIIKISRGKYIEDSLDVAIIRLDSIYHRKGVLCMINYYTSESHSTFDTVFASGVKDGVGRDCYRVISLRQENIIWGVGSTLPDVSQLVHGEKYLYQDPQGKWWLVQIASDGRTRELIELSDSLVTYTMFSDGSKWIADGRGNSPQVYQEGDTYSREEIDAFIYEATNTIKYVDFDNLTPTQIEKLRGPKGEQGDKGDPGSIGLQGEMGPRGYNGTIENFVVLSEAEYKALPFKDPYKFYFTYEEEDIVPITDFIAYVDGDVLVINSAVIDGTVLGLSSSQASYNGVDTLNMVTSGSTVSIPRFNPIPGTYDGSKTIEILCSTEGAEIRYTLDWTEPTQSSLLYTGPLTLDQTHTIKAKAFKLGALESRTAVGTYDLIFPNTVGTPVLSPEGGVYNQQQVVSIVCSTPGAIIRYTLDGTEPNETSAVYQGSIIVSDIINIVRARGFKAQHNASGTVTGVYEIGSQGIVQTPRFSITSGTYTIAQAVIISSGTTGATIRYTLDGTDPTLSSPIYTDPIIISSTTTLKAKAYYTGMVSSNINTIEVVIDNSGGDTPEPPEPTGNIEVNGSTVEDGVTGDRVEGTTWVILSNVRVENKTLII